MKVIIIVNYQTGERKRVKETNKYYNWYRECKGWNVLKTIEIGDKK